MKKRLISMLLLVVMVLGMLPVTALAAGSEEEALGEVNIYNGEQKLSYLSINGRIRELIYTYFNHVDANGRTKEIPAYCVNPNIYGIPQTVGPGESIKYIAKEKGSDPKVMGIIASGYPTRGLSELKLENKYHAYYATKMALWCYLLPNWNINNLKVNPNLTGAELQRAQTILAAAKDIYVRGTAWSKVLSPRVTATADRDTAYAVTVDGQQYKQQVFTVHSDTWVCDYAIRVAFSDPASVPAGTRIVDMNNKDITTITTSGTGDGYDGKFKVLYPAAAVAGKTGSVQLSFSTNVYQYAVFYATCAEVNKYGQLQNYMCDTDPTTTMKLSTYSNYSDGGGRRSAGHCKQSFGFYLQHHQGTGRDHSRLGHRAGEYVDPVPRCQPENAGLPLPVWWLNDRLCKRNSDRHRRDLIEKPRPLSIENRGCGSVRYVVTSPNRMRM